MTDLIYVAVFLPLALEHELCSRDVVANQNTKISVKFSKCHAVNLH